MNFLINKAPYISSYFHSAINQSKEFINTIPKTWIQDLKEVNYEELLSSSVGILALVFSWNKSEKAEFSEIASGTLASSIIHADPISTLFALVSYAYAYTKQKNKTDLRKFKWASIKGIGGVGAFALSTKMISIPVLNLFVGICAATAVHKTVNSLRMLEYFKFLRKLRLKIKKPVLKDLLSRRELISLNIFKFI